MSPDPVTSEKRLHPNDAATRHLSVALGEFKNLRTRAGQSESGRHYSVLITDLEKLMHVESGYFPRPLA